MATFAPASNTLYHGAAPSVQVAGPLVFKLASFVTSAALSSPAVSFVRRKEARNRAGTILRSEAEVLSCVLRYERIQTRSEIVPVTPMEQKIRVDPRVLDRVMEVLYNWDAERVSMHHPSRHAPARILLDNGKVLLLHSA